MKGYKRGDHVFNMGLRKKIDDLILEVRSLGHTYLSEFGLSSRLLRIQHTLEFCREKLQGPAFDLTVAKTAVPGEDANARRYGEAANQAAGAFRQFLSALVLWYHEAFDARPIAPGMLNTACILLVLAIGRWLDSAFDSESAALAIAESRQAAGLIERGQGVLLEVRECLVSMVKQCSPLIPPSRFL